MVAASSAVSSTAGPGPGPTAEASMSLPLAAKPAADMSPAKSCAVGAGQKALAPTLQSSKGNPRCQRPTPTRKTANLGPTQEAFVGQCWGHSTRRESRQNRRRSLEFQRQRCSAESWLPRLCRSRRAYRHTGQQVALKGILGPVPEWYLNGFATLERKGSATMKITKSCSGFCARKGCRNLVNPCLLHAFGVL